MYTHIHSHTHTYRCIQPDYNTHMNMGEYGGNYLIQLIENGGTIQKRLVWYFWHTYGGNSHINMAGIT